jgi:hypothetical protein
LKESILGCDLLIHAEKMKIWAATKLHPSWKERLGLLHRFIQPEKEQKFGAAT